MCMLCSSGVCMLCTARGESLTEVEGWRGRHAPRLGLMCGSEARGGMCAGARRQSACKQGVRYAACARCVMLQRLSLFCSYFAAARIF